MAPRLLSLLLCVAAAGAGCSCQRSEASAAVDARPDAAALSPEARFTRAEPGGRELPSDPGDLKHVRARGTLRILVEGDEQRFLPRAGTPTWNERQLVADFARRQGLVPEFILVEHFDELIALLLEGKADVIAAALTITESRKEKVAFTWPYETVSEVVVGKRGAPDLPRSMLDLAGRTLHVRQSSSFAETLASLDLKDAGSLSVEYAPENLDAEQLVYEVTRGRRPLAVVDSHMLAAIRTYNPDVEALFTLAEGREIAWAVRKDAPQLLAALNAFLIERSLTAHARDGFTGDLDEIRKRGVLRVLTRNNPVTYFLHRGRPFGFDYELAQMAAEDLGVRLEMVVAPSREHLIPWLLEGRGDVIAASLTVTAKRSKRVLFTRPYLEIEEMLVQPKTGDRLESLAQLSGRKVHVRRSSSYFDALTALQEEHGPFELVAAPEDTETEALIDQVAGGEIPLTVADSHLVQAELAHRDDIEALPLSEADDPKRAIAFAVRPGSPALHRFLDDFVRREHRGLRYNMARRRYFESERRTAEAKQERAGRTGRISPYDGLMKKYADRYGLDWRLVAAQAYQESRFDPDAQSWAGARGLFQVLPSTARALGFDDPSDPEQGVHAGVRYLSRVLRRLDPRIPFSVRVRFALAAYNVGIGHLIDARRLAEQRGLDPNRWFGHVEKAMLLLQRPEHYRRARHGYCRGSEPVKYVAEIQARYQQYVKLVQ